MNTKFVGNWPFWNNYVSTCPYCDNRYLGPKRSYTCWDCLNPLQKLLYEKDYEESK